MKKNDSVVAKTLENVRKIKGYGKKTVKILEELSKNTESKVYSLSSVRAVSSGNWFCEEIYDAMLILLSRDLELKKKRAKVSRSVSDGFNQLGQIA